MLRTAEMVATPPGIRVPYIEHGDPDGVPVLFLHGVTDSWRSWEATLDHLPRGIRAIALSVRGHGDADKPGIDYDIAGMAQDAVAVLDAAGVDRAVIAGSSMGAWIAQRLALVHPERVRALVLEAAFTAAGDDPDLAAFVEEVQALEDPLPEAVAREFQESTLAGPIDPELLDLYVAESLKVPAHVWRSAFRGFLDLDYNADLPRIGVPTLLLWGDQDAYTSRGDQDLLLAGIPQSRLIVYEGTGHAVHWEQTARVAADIATFVAGLG